MAKRGKFEKLGQNESYYSSHEGEKKTAEKTGVFDKISRKMEGKTQMQKNTGASEKFTFTKNTRSEIYEKRTAPALVSSVAKAPYVLAFSVMCIVLICGAFLSSAYVAQMSVAKGSALTIASYIVCYVAPVVVYIISSKERRKNNIKRFSLSFLPMCFVFLGLLFCIVALQKYYIAYTFSYSDNITYTSKNLMLTIIMSAFMPAVCEELFVHGVLQYEVSKYGGGICGIAVSSLVFALMHFELQYFFIYLVSGIILSSLTHITGSVFPAMLVHFLHNLLTVFLSSPLSYVATERIGGTLLMIVFAIFCFAFLIIALRMAQNVSESRAYDKQSEYNSDNVFCLTARESRTAKRLVKSLTCPFMLLIYCLFIIAVAAFSFM